MLAGGLKLGSGYTNLHGSWGRKTACKAEYFGEGTRRSVPEHSSLFATGATSLYIIPCIFPALAPTLDTCCQRAVWLTNRRQIKHCKQAGRESGHISAEFPGKRYFEQGVSGSKNRMLVQSHGHSHAKKKSKVKPFTLFILLLLLFSVHALNDKE